MQPISLVANNRHVLSSDYTLTGNEVETLINAPVLPYIHSYTQLF